MKTKTKKITQYSMLALAASAVVPMACKEETVADDPEIDATALNLSITNTGTGRDTEFVVLENEFDVFFGNIPEYQYLSLGFDGDTWFQKRNLVLINGYDWDMMRILPEGTTIDTAAAAWGNSNEGASLFAYVKVPAPGESSGIAGQGDKFFAFRKGDAPSFKYGWAKVNVSADANTLTIKEVAMANIFNKVVKVGAK